MSKENMPKWAKKLEDWGKEMEKKYGGKSGESSFSATGEQSQCSNNKSEWKRQNPVGEIFGQLISYFMLTYIPPYFPGFFLEGWSVVYTVSVFAIIIHVAVNLLQIVLTARPFYQLGKVIMELTGIVSMAVMVTIFPFNFPGNIGIIVQFALWIAIVILAIVTLFDFLKIFSPIGE